jgi:hypothetical protein
MMSEGTIHLKDKYGDDTPALFQHTDEDCNFVVWCPNSGDELIRGCEAVEGEFEIFSYDPVFEWCDIEKQLEEQMSTLRHPTVEYPHG